MPRRLSESVVQLAGPFTVFQDKRGEIHLSADDPALDTPLKFSPRPGSKTHDQLLALLAGREQETALPGLFERYQQRAKKFLDRDWPLIRRPLRGRTAQPFVGYFSDGTFEGIDGSVWRFFALPSGEHLGVQAMAGNLFEERYGFAEKWNTYWEVMKDPDQLHAKMHESDLRSITEHSVAAGMSALDNSGVTRLADQMNQMPLTKVCTIEDAREDDGCIRQALSAMPFPEQRRWMLVPPAA